MCVVLRLPNSLRRWRCLSSEILIKLPAGLRPKGPVCRRCRRSVTDAIVRQERMLRQPLNLHKYEDLNRCCPTPRFGPVSSALRSGGVRPVFAAEDTFLPCPMPAGHKRELLPQFRMTVSFATTPRLHLLGCSIHLMTGTHSWVIRL